MSLKYRPEVDGLRALAVLSVVLYHAEFYIKGEKILQGGFIGVDIFFVISGYLITSIVLKELEAGRFSFISFYDRRARRILPALFVVILASVPFALHLLLPIAMEDYSGSVLSAILMVANFWFAASDSYWGEPSALKPFLHTWSLAVEEQFYLGFPLLLLVCWKRLRRIVLPLLLVIFFSSLAYAQLMYAEQPQNVFFLLPARAWQLLAGGILAYLELTRGLAKPSGMASWLMPKIGIVMILASIVSFSENTPHPSVLTLIPVLGVVLLIRYSSPEEWVTRVLSARVIVFIGLISYSLYLWHYPIFAFQRISLGNIGDLHKWLGIVLAFILAIASYFFVERPCRRKELITTPKFLFCIGGLAAALLTFNYISYASAGLPGRYVDFSKLIAYEHYDYETPFMSHSCFLHPEDLPQDKLFPNCQYNVDDSSSKPVLMLWGDSNAAHLIPGIRSQYESDYQLLIRTTSGCGAFLGFEEPKRPGCKDINDDMVDLAEHLKPQKIIIAGLWKINFPELLEKTLFELKARGVENVYVVGPVPRWTGSLPRRLIAYGRENGRSKKLPKYLVDPIHTEVFAIESKLRAMVETQNTKYVSALDVLCNPENGCMTSLDNRDLVQWDYGHLTESGSQHLLSEIAEQLKD